MTAKQEEAGVNALHGDVNRLLLAARNNDEKRIRKLLQAGVDVNMKNSEGESALMFAVENHSNDMLKLFFQNTCDSTLDDAASQCLHLLLEKGADVNIRDISGSTPLIRASQNEDIHCMMTLLKAGADINLSDENGKTALMYSIKEKDMDCLNLLLEAGADANAQDNIGSTGLIYSTEYGYDRCVKLLLNSGAFANTANLDGTTALIAAVKQNNGKCISLLIQAGADVNICDQLQNTPLIYAAQNVDVKSELQLAKAGADVNQQDRYQCTALMWAIGKHIILREISPNDMPNGSDSHFTRNEETAVHESVSCLLQAGSDVNTPDSFGNTALSYAAKQGCTKCVNMVIRAGADANAPHGDLNQLLLAARNNDEKQIHTLLQAGIDVNMKDFEGQSALMFAVENHSNDILKLFFETEYGSTFHDAASQCLHLLLERGADVNIRDISGSTPLIRASQNEDMDCMMTLLKAGADINLSDENGKTGLMYSIKEKNMDCLKLLLEEGADVNVQDNIGSTGLIYSAEYGYDKCVKMLLNSEAFVNTANLDGTTALIAAVKQNNGKCVSLLIQARADVNISDKSQNTPLIYAAQNADAKSEVQLLKAGADVNKQCGYQCTALIWAIGKYLILRKILPNDIHKGYDSHFTQNEEMAVHESVSCLLQAGADVNTQDSFGNTALLYAAKHGCTKCVNMLIKAGADLNIKNEAREDALGISMRTFLGQSAQWKECALLLVVAGANVNGDVLCRLVDLECTMNVPCVIKCITAGADVNQRASHGYTPLMVAVRHRCKNIIHLLLNAGADVNIQGHFQYSTLHLAYNSIESIKILLQAEVMINVMDKYNHNALQHAIAEHGARSICMLLFAAGETTEDTTLKKFDIWGNVTHVPVPDYLRNIIVPQLCLKHQCRMTIRKHLINKDPHTHLFTRAPELGLPKPLEKYVLFHEEMV